MSSRQIQEELGRCGRAGQGCPAATSSRVQRDEFPGWKTSACRCGSGVPAQLDAGGGHGQIDEALAGWLMHLPEAEDREPVEQGGEAEGEDRR